MVVAVAVQATLQLLTVCRVHEDDVEELDFAKLGLFDSEEGRLVSTSGPTSLRASNIGFKSF